MEPLRQLRARTVVLPYPNIDTDQIIPARFLRTTGRDALGKELFHDWRYAPDGRPRADFPLNQASAAGCAILVAGPNFGCGSSREHAPWALLDYGFRAVISTSIADIFTNNALKNGLLPIVLEAPVVERLNASPGVELVIDLERNSVRLPDGATAPFVIERFARYCLLHGTDELGYLQSQQDAIARYEQRRDRSRSA